MVPDELRVPGAVKRIHFLPTRKKKACGELRIGKARKLTFKHRRLRPSFVYPFSLYRLLASN